MATNEFLQIGGKYSFKYAVFVYIVNISIAKMENTSVTPFSEETKECPKLEREIKKRKISLEKKDNVKITLEFDDKTDNVDEHDNASKYNVNYTLRGNLGAFRE